METLLSSPLFLSRLRVKQAYTVSLFSREDDHPQPNKEEILVVHPSMYAHVDGNHDNLFSSSSLRDVTYSCGGCGYALNLSSSNRNTSQIDSKYGKAIKKGIISFFCVDESRFTQIDEFKCVPYFIVRLSWGLLQPRTKLLCRKCGNYIGHAIEESIPPFGPDYSDSSSGTGASVCRKYNVRIRSVQPSDESGTLLL